MTDETDKTPIRMLHDRVLVSVDDQGERRSSGGIVIPATAEAERKQAEAERLAAAADERHRVAGEARDEHQAHLRRADEVDPDVDHKAERGTEPAAETDGVAPSEQRVTHPDGTTETVNDPRER